MRIIAMSIFSILLLCGEALAAKKPVGPNDFYNVTVKVNLDKKKTADRTVSCYNKKPGKVTKSKKKQFFTPYSEVLKAASAQARKATGKKQKSLKKEVAILKQLAKTKACAAGNGGNLQPTPTPTPVPTETPQFLSLETYTGTFGRREAKILFDRFGFGASPHEINQAVADGMQTTVDRLMTWADDPALDAYLADYGCDGRLAGEANDRTCNPENPNDFYSPALRYEIYARAYRLQQRFFIKLYTWLMDDRGAGVTRDINGCSLHALKAHHKLLLKAARSGDYIQFARDYMKDLLGHIIALNGQSNQANSVNEDFGREILELITIGTHNLDGVPNYNDADVQASARAFTGWKVEQYSVAGNNICYAAFVPGLHDDGPKTLFGGTPYATTVYGDEDVLRAIFSRSDDAAAINLAKELWAQFINPYADKATIQVLAQKIRAANYQLFPVLRELMTSQALYAGVSEKSLIKEPLDLVLGFRIQSEIPAKYDLIDAIMRDGVNQQPLNPPTVFGTYPEKLAGEAYVLDWRNSLRDLVYQNETALFNDFGFQFRENYFNTLRQSTNPAETFVLATADRLNVNLTAEQQNLMVTFLNYDIANCSGQGCANDPDPGYFYQRNVFDPNPDSNSRHPSKAKALLMAMAQLPYYRLK